MKVYQFEYKNYYQKFKTKHHKNWIKYFNINNCKKKNFAMIWENWSTRDKWNMREDCEILSGNFEIQLTCFLAPTCCILLSTAKIISVVEISVVTLYNAAIYE